MGAEPAIYLSKIAKLLKCMIMSFIMHMKETS